MGSEPKGGIRLRRAEVHDVGAITEIYNDAVLTTTGTFDTEPRSLPDRLEWFGKHSPRHPVLVAEEDGTVVGWASLSPWSERPAYDATAEVSVYVRSAERGRGLGRRLLAALVEAAGASGHHALLARVAEGNDASLRLHRSAKFVEVGIMRQVGVKFGRRLDVHLLERLLPEPEGAGPHESP